ncbi:Cro/CI family transcriptional regulator [uncultured Endozoicomonas sp.]|uniref:transcriptional regulator n=1 Tax=uncultured Endozoicomonas sp. TaxID=432652 RepID=UPI00260B9671|nr:Cro/CI family transcriptional regulator [uncultured Endozoicomonas sp.]
MDAIEKAAKIAGSKRKLARLLGITAQAVSKWERIPSDRVIQIERLLERKINRQELRPDLYPPEPE